jgi:hypothetical protein
MAVATPIKTEEEIQRDVLAELKWDARFQPNEIGVIVKDGVVTLTGWVDTFLKKWSAEDAAHKLTGVKAVANEIEVRLARERTDMDRTSRLTRCAPLSLTRLCRNKKFKSQFRRDGSLSGVKWSGSTRRRKRKESSGVSRSEGRQQSYNGKAASNAIGTQEEN